MANTAAENALAQTAYKAIAARYAPYFNMNPSMTKFTQALMMGTGIENYVKFMDSTAFMTNFGNHRVGAGCAVCGFTAPSLLNKYDREMYINRTFANSSTVIHEMLHFMTHPLFWDFVPSAITEAVTEYYTRKVILRSVGDDFDISQREGRYDAHHALLTQTRQFLKAPPPPRRGRGGGAPAAPPPPNYMKSAYFQGDLTAIAYVKEKFSDLQEITDLKSSS